MRGAIAVTGVILSMLGIVQVAGGQPLLPANIGGNVRLNPNVQPSTASQTTMVSTAHSTVQTTSVISTVQSIISMSITSTQTSILTSATSTTSVLTISTGTTSSQTFSSQTINTETQTSISTMPSPASFPSPLQILIRSSVPPLTFLFAGVLLMVLSLFIGNEIDQQETQDSSYQV